MLSYPYLSAQFFLPHILHLPVDPSGSLLSLHSHLAIMLYSSASLFSLSPAVEIQQANPGIPTPPPFVVMFIRAIASEQAYQLARFKSHRSLPREPKRGSVADLALRGSSQRRAAEHRGWYAAFRDHVGDHVRLLCSWRSAPCSTSPLRIPLQWNVLQSRQRLGG